MMLCKKHQTGYYKREIMKESNFVIFAVLFLTGILLYVIGGNLLYDILTAGLLSLAMHKFNIFIYKRFKRKSITIAISTIVIFLIFYSLVLYALIALIPYLQQLDINIVGNTITDLVHDILKKVNLIPANIKSAIGKGTLNISLTLLGLIKNITSISATFFINIIIICIIYFIFCYYSRNILVFIRKALPLSKKNFLYLRDRIINTLYIVFYSIIITAILEGFLFGMMAYILGFNGLFLGVIYGFASLIPGIGGVLVWLPVSLYAYFIDNSLTNALIMSIYSIIVISIIADTFVKPMIIYYVNKNIIKSKNRLNEFLIFLSMLIGIGNIGFWGVLIGPVLLTLALTFFDIFSRRNKEINE